jgi:hypothetical protein
MALDQVLAESQTGSTDCWIVTPLRTLHLDGFSEKPKRMGLLERNSRVTR